MVVLILSNSKIPHYRSRLALVGNLILSKSLMESMKKPGKLAIDFRDNCTKYSKISTTQSHLK